MSLRRAWLACLLAAGTPLASAGPAAERYVLKSFPADGQGSRLEETVSADYVFDPSGVTYSSRMVSERRVEEVVIRTDPEARLIEARRRVLDAQGREASSETISVKGEVAQVRRLVKGRTRSSTIPLKPGMEPAADASLLLLLRREALSAGLRKRYFMIDFSGRSVTVTAAGLGIETLDVPAGRFDCARIEVTVDVPILKPRITYWLSATSPHFLVQHHGKRGPFTRTFTTVLVGN
ncbi:MAG: DUF3108 domain-containing protein [Elusimicrobia bacterium]|nr:DUF3108 domain-containing protein [Elusimicrobiota bacterium]